MASVFFVFFNLDFCSFCNFKEIVYKIFIENYLYSGNTCNFSQNRFVKKLSFKVKEKQNEMLKVEIGKRIKKIADENRERHVLRSFTLLLFKNDVNFFLLFNNQFRLLFIL